MNTHRTIPNRSGADSILRAVKENGSITRETLTELLELLRTKTDYHVHVEIAVLPSGSALLKTIDNERDALETVRRLKATRVKKREKAQP